MNSSCDPWAAVIEDSSKVGRGGGQIISELVAKTLSESGLSVALLDFGTRDKVWHLQPSDRITLSSGSYRTQWSILRSLRPKLVYCATKRAFLVGLLFKLTHPASKLFFHIHNLSKIPLFDWTLSLISSVFCELTLFPSEFTRRRFALLKHSRQRVIGNPSEVPDVSNELQENIRIGFVGRLNLEKGFPTFANLCKRFFGTSLQFVAITQEEVSQVRREEFPHILFHTQVPQSLVHEKYDVLMVLSNVPETYSLSAVEAARAGKLVLATTNGAIREVLGDYEGLVLLDNVLNAQEVLHRVEMGLLPHRYSPLQDSHLVHDTSGFMSIIAQVLTEP